MAAKKQENTWGQALADGRLRKSLQESSAARRGPPRFGKATVSEYITKRLGVLLEKHHFDAGNGYAQVRGKGEEVNRAYGEWDVLLQMAEAFEIELPSELFDRASRRG